MSCYDTPAPATTDGLPVDTHGWCLEGGVLTRVTNLIDWSPNQSISRGRPVVTSDRKDRKDRKDRAGEGEYCELTRLLGGEPFSMRIGGGGTVINPLDPLDPQVTAVICGRGRERS